MNASTIPVVSAALLMASCAGPVYQAIDHRKFQRTGDSVSTKVWRGLAKSTPWTSKAAFHGNWGGSGNRGGKPVDKMDEGFRRHDVVYHESRDLEKLVAADRALVEWLEAIDERGLDDEAKAYRLRAIRFMNSRVSKVVGKPLSVVLGSQEREGSLFDSPEAVARFFDASHSGFPVAKPAPRDSGTSEPAERIERRRYLVGLRGKAGE